LGAILWLNTSIELKGCESKLIEQKNYAFLLRYAFSIVNFTYVLHACVDSTTKRMQTNNQDDWMLHLIF